jgi:predicted nucleic acid-binding protein
MALYFFDSSALVKRHVNESGSRWVRSLTHVKADHTIYLSRITTVEIVSAITRRQRGRSLSVAQGAAILGHFRRHLAQRYNILELTPSLLVDAMTMARKHGLRAYDAVQLAAVIEVSRIHHDAGSGLITMISADHELNIAAVAEGLTVEDPNLHP